MSLRPPQSEFWDSSIEPIGFVRVPVAPHRSVKTEELVDRLPKSPTGETHRTALVGKERSTASSP